MPFRVSSTERLPVKFFHECSGRYPIMPSGTIPVQTKRTRLLPILLPRLSPRRQSASGQFPILTSFLFPYDFLFLMVNTHSLTEIRCLRCRRCCRHQNQNRNRNRPDRKNRFPLRKPSPLSSPIGTSAPSAFPATCRPERKSPGRS